MHRKTVICMIALIALALFIVVSCGKEESDTEEDKSNVAGGWKISVVDDQGTPGSPNRIALNSSGDPVIAYYDSDNQAIRIAFWEDGWEVETILEGGVEGGVDMVLVNDNPNVIYCAGGLWLAVLQSNGSYQKTQLDPENGCVNSVAADDNGNIYVAAYINATNNLKYYTNRDSEEHVFAGYVAVDGASGVKDVAISASPGGRPFIAYATSNVFWGTTTQAIWDFSQIGSGEYVSQTTDGSEGAYVFGAGEDGLTFYSLSVEGDNDSVSVTGEQVTWPSIHIGTSGRIHGSFTLNGAVYYATEVDSKWEADGVVVEVGDGAYSSVTSNDADDAFIAFLDTKTGRLLHVTNKDDF